MRHIKRYNLFESERPTISYDFDGVVHQSVIGLDPINFDQPESWVPFTKMHDRMKEDSKSHRIIIVTARRKTCDQHLRDFIKMYDLPVEEIFYTDNSSKVPILLQQKAIKHYDDNLGLAMPLRSAGIEFIHVDPKIETYKIMESEATMQKFNITFTNDKFFIADNTLEAFLNRLKKMDPSLTHDKKSNGAIKNGRIAYVKSSVLNASDIRSEAQSFTPRYEHLHIHVATSR